MAATAPKTWYVYTYAYPDSTVFYVGKGTGNRLFTHEKEAKGICGCKKCRTIRAIWASNQPVQIRIVFETLNEAKALSHEQEVMAQHQQTIVNMRRSLKLRLTGVGVKYPLHVSNASEILTITEVVDTLGLTYLDVISLAHQNALVGFKVGKQWRFHRDDVENYINAQKQKQQHQR